MLAAERIRIGALLDLISAEAVGFESGAAGGAGLIDHAAERGDEDLPLAVEDHAGLRQRDARIAAQFCVDGEQQRELFFHADREWIDPAGRDPGGFVLVFGREHHVVLLGERAGARDFDGQRGGGLHAGLASNRRWRRNPSSRRPARESRVPADSELDTWPGFPFLVERSRSRLSTDADVGVGDAGPQRGIERFERKLLHDYQDNWLGSAGIWQGVIQLSRLGVEVTRQSSMKYVTRFTAR